MAPRAVLSEPPALDLPPAYTLVTLREAGDAFAHARAIAADAGAGTLVWTRRFDVAEFAVVLEPAEPLRAARRVFFAAMNALADAVAAHAPPEKPIAFDWPGGLRLDGALLGGARLAWPERAAADATPDWLVFGAIIRTAPIAAREPGARPEATSLADEGAEDADDALIVASAARHLMRHLDRWSARGPAPAIAEYLARLSGLAPGAHAAIDAEGDLVLGAERRAFLPALAAASWLDPATGAPRS